MSGEFPRDFSVSAELGREAEALVIGMLAHGGDWTLHRVATFEDRLSTYMRLSRTLPTRINANG